MAAPRSWLAVSSMRVLVFHCWGCPFLANWTVTRNCPLVAGQTWRTAVVVNPGGRIAWGSQFGCWNEAEGPAQLMACPWARAETMGRATGTASAATAMTVVNRARRIDPSFLMNVRNPKSNGWTRHEGRNGPGRGGIQSPPPPPSALVGADSCDLTGPVWARLGGNTGASALRISLQPVN